MAKRNSKTTVRRLPDPEPDADERDEPTEAEIERAALELAESEGLADNARDVPMFADIDGRTSRSISKLRLTKMEAGGPPAYKGMLPTSTTLDTIGQMFGDGIYTIEGVNHRNTVLAVKENVRISLGAVPAATQALATQSANENDRIERLARVSAVESQQNSQAFVQLITTTMQATAEREARAYQANAQQMQQYFAAMMTQAQAMFQQTIVMMSTGHNMTIQALEAVQKNRDVKKPSDGDTNTKMVEMLLKGVKLSRELTGEDKTEKPMWADILQNGLSVLAHAKGEPSAAQSQHPPALPAPTGAAPRVLSPAAKRKIREAMQFYDAVRARGIDPQDFIARLSEAEALASQTPSAHTAAPEHTGGDDEDPDTEDSDESDENDENDVLDDEDEDDELDDGEDEESAEDNDDSHARA